MLSCKKATQLMSEKQDRSLQTSEKLSLKFHLMLCNGCRNYNDQLYIIHKACQHISGREHD